MYSKLTWTRESRPIISSVGQAYGGLTESFTKGTMPNKENVHVEIYKRRSRYYIWSVKPGRAVDVNVGARKSLKAAKELAEAHMDYYFG